MESHKKVREVVVQDQLLRCPFCDLPVTAILTQGEINVGEVEIRPADIIFTCTDNCSDSQGHILVLRNKIYHKQGDQETPT